ncbi:MAG TPA: AMP-binding protein [Oxalicibacterium sp.]|jgi:acyl-CoA synthetase (AMP-forming)/AMP-acid ligase II|nr:AMP-binding protein [Oxalicibacterium sp.]
MNRKSVSFFEILRSHARAQPEVIASRSSRRAITYRRLWSRVERASARLLGEWQVQRGDVVAYWGYGHQDALTFYLAAARCGLRLLPFEDPLLRQNADAVLAQHPARLILHDPGQTSDVPRSVAKAANLSSLIARPCQYDPEVAEDDATPSLITFTNNEDGSMHYGESSLASLQTTAGTSDSSFQVDAALLNAAVLANHVLPVLTAGGTIVFR